LRLVREHCLNKIDLPQADPDRVAQEIEDIIGLEAMDAVQCSAKTGVGIDDLLEELVTKIPEPVGDETAPLTKCKSCRRAKLT